MSKHVAFVKAAAISFTAMPSGLTELFNNTNKRLLADLTGRIRVRVYVAGGVSGGNSAELRVQYTLDLTGATGWDYLDGVDGPWVPICMLNNQPTQLGAWVDVVEAARTVVLLRVIGIGGSGNNPTISHLGAEFDLREPVYPANSIENSPGGRQIVFYGGSQMSGAEHGSFGAIEDVSANGDHPNGAAIRAVLEPLFVLGHGGGGITYIRNGVAQTTIPAEFGPEIGTFYRLVQANKHVGLRFLGQYASTTPIETWLATEFANVQAAITSAGMTPSLFGFIWPGQNSTTLNQLANAIRDLPKLQSLIETTYSCPQLCMGVVAQDAVTFTVLTEARRYCRAFFENPIRGRRGHIEFDRVAIELQPEDNTHPNAKGTFDMGYYGYGPDILASGILG